MTMLSLNESSMLVLVLIVEAVVVLSRFLHPVPRVELPLLAHAVAHHLVRTVTGSYVVHYYPTFIHHRPHLVGKCRECK